jgi:hypothetical protein
MRSLLAAALAALAFPALGHAAGASLSVRDLPVRQSGIAQVPRTFDLVGIHWQGPGRVLFRTRSTAGHWSSWEGAAPEEDGPDSLNVEGMEASPWRIGDPFWTGAADAIQYRHVGAVKRVRAYFVSSPAVRIPPRTLSIAGSPPIISRAAWGANEAIRRAPPRYAPAVHFALVHHTAGTNNYGPAQSAAIVRGIELYHVQGNGWDDIGYNFLVDRFGQVFEGRYGGITRAVVGAHAEGFNYGSVGVAVLGTYTSTPISPAARSALVSLLAWRLDVAHIDPFSSLTWPSGGNPRFAAGRPVLLRAISGHRDTGFTSCPGSTLYAQLPGIARAVAATGLPKLYAPIVRGKLGGPIRFTARLSTALPWTVTIRDSAKQIVASGAGQSAAVDWTWDATLAPSGAYSYSIAAGPTVRAASGTIGTPAAPLALTDVSASLATFSPNGDGRAEQTTISYRLSVPALVSAVLLDANGTQVASLFTAQTPAGRHSLVFRATGFPDGPYRIVLTAETSDGRTATASVSVLVNRTLAGFAALPTPFSPNGDGRRDSALLTFSLAYPVAAELHIERARQPVATIFAGPLPAGQQQLVWDGRIGSAPAPDARYVAVLTVTDALGTASQRAALTIDTTPPTLRLLSLRQLRFRLSERAVVTLLVNGARIRKLEPRGVFHVPFKGVPRTLTAVAEDRAGNRGAPLQVG